MQLEFCLTPLSIPHALAACLACLTTIAGLRCILVPQAYAASFGFPQLVTEQQGGKMSGTSKPQSLATSTHTIVNSDMTGGKRVENPFITALGYRFFTTALTLLALVFLRDDKATGTLLLFNAASMFGDAVLCARKGTEGSAAHHTVAASISGGLGAWLVCRRT